MRLKAKGMSGTGSLTRGAFLIAAWLFVGACLGAGSVQAAPKSLVSEIGGAGTQGGQFNGARGLAVNQLTGDLYVADGGNNRIQQLTSDGTFIRAWGTDVIAAGKPGDTGTGFEICEVAEDCKAGTSTGGAAGQVAQPMGLAIDQTNGYVYVTSLTNRRVDVFSSEGDFAGAFGWGVDTGASMLELCTTTSTCQQGAAAGPDAGRISGWIGSDPAIDPSAPPGTIYVPDSGVNLRVSKFATTIAGGQLSAVTFLKAFGWDVAPGPVDEEQEIRVRATAGQFTLSFGGDTTTDLPFNASAAEVETALNDLPSINSGGGSVTVSGGVGNASGSNLYVVRFSGGPLAGTDVANLLAADGTTPLTGGTPASSVTVTVRANGGTSTELESCTAASGCKAGTSGGGIGQFVSGGSPISTSVDSTGAVYVVSGPLQNANNNCAPATPCRVFKFDSSTSSATILGPDIVAGKVGEVAALDVAVDPSNDHVLVSRRTETGKFHLTEYDSGGSLVEAHPADPLASASTTVNHGLEVGTDDRLYVSQTGTSLYLLGEVPKPPQPVIDPVTDVTATSATFHGKVTVASLGSMGFDTSWRFEYSANGSKWTSIPTLDVPLGNAPGVHEVEQTVSGLAPNTEYLVRLVASTSSGTVRSEPVEFTTLAAAPRLSETSAVNVTQTSATLGAWVDPQGLKTTYHVEWATEKVWKETGQLNQRAPGFERSLGSGNEALTAKEFIDGLNGGSAYYFRVVASNAHGTTVGPVERFETLNACGLTGGRCYELVSPADKGPVGSAGEVVVLGQELQFQAATSRSAIHYQMGYGLPNATSSTEVAYQAVRTSTGWKSFEVAPPHLVPPKKGSPLPSRTLGLSEDLDCGIYNSNQPLVEDAPVKVREAGYGLLYRRAGTDGSGAFTLLTGIEPSVIPPDSQIPEYPTGPYQLVGVSEGPGDPCDRVIFRTPLQYPGVSGAGTNRLYEWDRGVLRNVGVVPGPSGLENAGVVPGATQSPATDPANQPLQKNRNVHNAVSRDGSRIVFTALSKIGGDSGQQAVFVRDHAGGTGTLAAGSKSVSDVALEFGVFAVGQEISGEGIPSGTLIEAVEEVDGRIRSLTLSQPAEVDAEAVTLDALRVLDASQSQTATANNGASRYETATPDGKYVFFTARYGLANNGSSGGVGACSIGVDGAANGPGCDLYRYSVDDGVLVDVSIPAPGAVSPNGAGVIGVLGTSNDGRYVYFAARGQLVEGAGRTEQQNLATDSYSIYRADIGAGSVSLEYVASIAASLASRKLTATSGGGFWNSEVSADGRYLLFSSTERLSDYDNMGTPQAYLYDGETGDLRCVSCPLSEDPPVAGPPGRDDPLGRGGEDVENRLRPPVRLVGEGDGVKVILQSYDALAVGGAKGRLGFYLWENGQVSMIGTSTLESGNNVRFAGASRSGDEIYFTTYDQLSWQDTDRQVDIYTARVGGAVSPQSSPPAVCDPLAEGSCQPYGGVGLPAAPPAIGSTAVGPGNSVTDRHSKRPKSKRKKAAKKKKTRGKRRGKKGQSKGKRGGKGRRAHRRNPAVREARLRYGRARHDRGAGK